MALPAYKSKELHHPSGIFTYTITIGGKGRGWYVSGITIQCFTGYGAKLIIKNIPKLDHWASFPKPKKDQVFNLIKPSYITKLISLGLKLGWKPSHDGSNVDFTLDLDSTPLTTTSRTEGKPQ